MFEAQLQQKPGTLRSKTRPQRQRERQKTISLISQTTTLHVSLPFFHYYDVKMPNFAFDGDSKQATTKFPLSELRYAPLVGLHLTK